MSHFDLLINTHTSIGKIGIESIWPAKDNGRREQILVGKTANTQIGRPLPQKILDSKYMKFAELILQDKVGSLQYSPEKRTWTARRGETGKFLF